MFSMLLGPNVYGSKFLVQFMIEVLWLGIFRV